MFEKREVIILEDGTDLSMFNRKKELNVKNRRQSLVSPRINQIKIRKQKNPFLIEDEQLNLGDDFKQIKVDLNRYLNKYDYKLAEKVCKIDPNLFYDKKGKQRPFNLLKL